MLQHGLVSITPSKWQPLNTVRKKIRFNSIAAGLIQTDMTDAMFTGGDSEARFIPHIPLGRMGTIEDIAQAALWLADEEKSGFINGQLIDVSGGQHNGKLP